MGLGVRLKDLIIKNFTLLVVFAIINAPVHAQAAETKSPIPKAIQKIIKKADRQGIAADSIQAQTLLNYYYQKFLNEESDDSLFDSLQERVENIQALEEERFNQKFDKQIENNQARWLGVLLHQFVIRKAEVAVDAKLDPRIRRALIRDMESQMNLIYPESIECRTLDEPNYIRTTCFMPTFWVKTEIKKKRYLTIRVPKFVTVDQCDVPKSKTSCASFSLHNEVRNSPQTAHIKLKPKAKIYLNANKATSNPGIKKQFNSQDAKKLYEITQQKIGELIRQLTEHKKTNALQHEKLTALKSEDHILQNELTAALNLKNDLANQSEATKKETENSIASTLQSAQSSLNHDLVYGAPIKQYQDTLDELERTKKQLSDAESALAAFIQEQGSIDQRMEQAKEDLKGVLGRLIFQLPEEDEFVLLIDGSGSIWGGCPPFRNCFDYAVQGIALTLSYLKPNQKFNVGVFADYGNIWSKKAVYATPANIKKAVEYLKKCASNGAISYESKTGLSKFGTGSSESLAAALDLTKESFGGHSPQRAYILTDASFVSQECYAISTFRSSDSIPFTFKPMGSVDRSGTSYLTGQPGDVMLPSQTEDVRTELEALQKLIKDLEVRKEELPGIIAGLKDQTIPQLKQKVAELEQKTKAYKGPADEYRKKRFAQMESNSKNARDQLIAAQNQRLAELEKASKESQQKIDALKKSKFNKEQEIKEQEAKIRTTEAEIKRLETELGPE